MKTRNDDGKFDLEWWATADLEGINAKLAHSIVREMATEHMWTPGAQPDMDKLARVQVNMQKYIARGRRDDTALNHSIALKWLAVSVTLAGVLSTLLWQMDRLLA